MVASLPPGVRKAPASGALPGHALKCTRTNPTAMKSVTLCLRASKAFMVKGKSGFGPQLAVPIRTVFSYDAVVAAGWTNAKPKLPPVYEQFSMATQGKG